MNFEFIQSKQTFLEKAQLFFVHRILMPLTPFLVRPKIASKNVHEHAYGEHPDETLDLIDPFNKDTISPIPLVHIHGGGWVAGSKGQFYARPFLKFSQAGFPIVSINYPLAPNTSHPDVLRSLLKAMKWVHQKYPNGIYLLGDSAGGNLAMMVGLMLTNPDSLNKIIDQPTGDDYPEVKKIANIYGINDRFSWIEDGFPGAALFLKSYAGSEALNPHFHPKIPITPVEFTEIHDLPPTFIIGGENDPLLRSSKLLAEYLSKFSTDIRFSIFEDAQHGFFCFGKGCEELSDDLLNFFLNKEK
jgi:acetyl esterase/lipase